MPSRTALLLLGLGSQEDVTREPTQGSETGRVTGCSTGGALAAAGRLGLLRGWKKVSCTKPNTALFHCSPETLPGTQAQSVLEAGSSSEAAGSGLTGAWGGRRRRRPCPPTCSSHRRPRSSRKTHTCKAQVARPCPPSPTDPRLAVSTGQGHVAKPLASPRNPPAECRSPGGWRPLEETSEPASVRRSSRVTRQSEITRLLARLRAGRESKVTFQGPTCKKSTRRVIESCVLGEGEKMGKFLEFLNVRSSQGRTEV